MYDPTKPYKNEILNLIKPTLETKYVSVKGGVVTKKFTYGEYHHTDGIGTKGIYHWKQRSFRNAVIDAFMMNYNDLAMMRATPYAIIDHLFIPEDDKTAIFDILKCLSEECKKRDIAITGGETAIHNNISGMDISISMLGFIKKPKQNKFKEGDVLIGFKSSGLHSNGFTKVIEMFGDKYEEDFIVPTKSYWEDINLLNEQIEINGMMHITGGAYTKLKDLLYKTNAVITNNHKLKPHNIFKKLYEKGISDEEMYKTFNCGIGFIISVPKEAIKNIKFNGDMDIIGEIISGDGNVIINSQFSNKRIKF